VTTVVAERPRRIDVLFGFLAVAFGAALVRGHLGAGSDRSRLVIDVLLGALVLAIVVTWIGLRRHPASLEITPDWVVLTHAGLQRKTGIDSDSGELYFTVSGGRARMLVLKATAADETISLQMFDRREVEAGLRANGWRFVGDP
jgi:hypothetical protein